ncbi:MAG: tRNA pseudouridine(55) synthase TruB [Cyanobacteriota bacterium]|nr:tRNA pseudouridine(55) synthase TruB [Cyanobacteriota bacterium]
MTCGFLVLDKPAGLSSHSCVARVRRAYGLKRVGHGGTLDPAVTGVLPLALGAATRLLPYLCGDKAYRGVIQLGLRTNSDDLEGEVLERCPLPAGLDAGVLEEALEAFRGHIAQIPPQVSAVHVNGQRAYKLARQGQTLTLAARPVQIQQLTLLAWDPDLGQLEVVVQCSAGTYIRSLARDLGAALGCGGTLARLRRTAALGFNLQQAVAWNALEPETLAAGGPLPPLLDPLSALGHLPWQQLNLAEQGDWRCGRQVQAAQPWPTEQTVVITTTDGRWAGMATATPEGRLQPKLVLDAAG